MELAKQYNWLRKETNPIIVEALKLVGITEVKGAKSNPEIIKMAILCGVGDIYKSDETAWCALAQSYVCLKSGFDVKFIGYERLRAKSFEVFGVQVDNGKEMLGDILVFRRSGGGHHVGIYVGEDETAFHVLGGNQSDSYCIVRIEKRRLYVCRRAIYKTPTNLRKVMLSKTGSISVNEK